jgi:DNA-binding CsgD family transcriptional regulator
MEMVSSLLARLDEDSGLEERLMATALAMEAAWMGLLSEATAFEYYRELCASGALANEDWDRGWFAFRAWRLGLEPPEGHIFRPIRLELEGHPEEAATVWEERGYPIEATITRACAPGADLEGAFSNLKRLGAEGVASGLRRELGRRGVKGIPRGVRSSTKSHPAGLTSRQAEVLDLMVAGHSNAAIAEELYISEKTTGHHVSAILSKLGATNRSQAVAMALARGWTDLGS